MVTEPASEPTPEPTPEPAPVPTDGPVSEHPAPDLAPAEPTLPEPAPQLAPDAGPAPVASEMNAAVPLRSEQSLEPAAEPAPVALSSKLAEEPIAEETSEPRPIPDATAPNVAEPSTHRPPRPENSAARMAGDLARTVDKLLGSLPEQVAEISGWVGEVADGMGKAVSAAMAELFGGGEGAPSPVDVPLVPSVPAAPVPAAPIPVGGPSVAGGSSPSWTLSSAADHEKLLQHFAVLVLFSLALLQGGERRWIAREALAPSLLARPPNERPG